MKKEDYMALILLAGFILGAIGSSFVWMYFLDDINKDKTTIDNEDFEKLMAERIYCNMIIENASEKAWTWWTSPINLSDNALSTKGETQGGEK